MQNGGYRKDWLIYKILIGSDNVFLLSSGSDFNNQSTADTYQPRSTQCDPEHNLCSSVGCCYHYWFINSIISSQAAILVGMRPLLPAHSRQVLHFNVVSGSCWQ